MSMRRKTSILRKYVFLASPGDVQEERHRFPSILEKMNDMKAHALGIHLEPSGWERVSPGFGRAQGLINESLDYCDLFVMLLWRRWGMPPGGQEYSSGTEEEFERACALCKKRGRPAIHLYFRQVSPDFLSDPGPQLKQVLDFRKRIESEHLLLYGHYSDPVDWQDKLERNIAQWLDALQETVASRRTPVSRQTKAVLPAEIRAIEADSVAQARHYACDTARQAAESAREGLFTQAEELYARAIQTYPELSVIRDRGLYYERYVSWAKADASFRQLLNEAVRQGSREYVRSAMQWLDTMPDVPARDSVRARDLIRKKSLGLQLSKPEIQAFVQAFTRGDMPDYQASALLVAIFLRGLDLKETSDLIESMVQSGAVLDLSQSAGPKVNLHSTGAVGDKTPLIVAAAAAAGGCVVPMVSGRGLGHIGGTLDKLESVPGIRFPGQLNEISAILRNSALVFAGSLSEIAPADRRLYALRDVTSTVESPELICASILSKRLAEGLDALVIDVKHGRGAFMKDIDAARDLARKFWEIGQLLSMRVDVVMSPADQPLGYAVGNLLEFQEAVLVLKGKGPEDVITLSRELTAGIFVAAGIASSFTAGRTRFDQLIASGEALEAFRQCVVTQGGDGGCVDDPERMEGARHQEPVLAARSGYISGIDADGIGHSVFRLGGGREHGWDLLDSSAGILLHKKIGDVVRKNETICTLHASELSRIAQAKELAADAIQISDEHLPRARIRIERLEPAEY
jgi:pyrimidine-nucleoside phosphorylase